MPHEFAWLFLVAAGVVSGIIGTAGGITSLVAYPALLAVGIPPLAANVTNSVALLGSGFSSAGRAGPDLAGQGRLVLRWGMPIVALSLGGALLLVNTPAGVFDRIVPFLVAIGALTLLVQPMVISWQRSRGRSFGRLPVALSLVGVAVYNGYFGAGAGILMIALLAFTVEPVLHRANAMKNVMLFAADLLPAVVFAVTGLVAWSAAIPLGVGAFLGGLLGPSIARRMPAGALRVFIAVCGFVLAIWLFLR